MATLSNTFCTSSPVKLSALLYSNSLCNALFALRHLFTLVGVKQLRSSKHLTDAFLITFSISATGTVLSASVLYQYELGQQDLSETNISLIIKGTFKTNSAIYTGVSIPYFLLTCMVNSLIMPLPYCLGTIFAHLLGNVGKTVTVPILNILYVAAKHSVLLYLNVIEIYVISVHTHCDFNRFVRKFTVRCRNKYLSYFKQLGRRISVIIVS